MVKNFVHILRTYLISFQYLLKKNIKFIWNFALLSLVVYLLYVSFFICF